jgi:hypothetical protein
MTHDLIEAVEDAVARALDRHLTSSPWKDGDAAATYLACSPNTLRTWRTRGEGPIYHIIQNKLIRYHVDDLDAFVRGEANR